MKVVEAQYGNQHHTVAALEMVGVSAWFADYCCALTSDIGIDRLVEVMNMQLSQAGLERRRRRLN